MIHYKRDKPKHFTGSKMKILAIIGLAFLLLLPCGCQAEEISADLGQEVSLKLGQTANIEAEQLKIGFDRVVSDSRCPTGAECIWQGEVSCLLQITYDGQSFEKTIVQPGLTQEPARDTFQDYQLTFNIEPYPEVDKQISSCDYRLMLTVDRAAELSGGILATFDVQGEQYSIFVTNQDTIEDILALQRGDSQASILSGKIIAQPAAYNAPWSWHIDPEDIHMAEFTIELCDGLPSHVENDLDYWANTVGRFCPWSAQLVSVQDYR
jgi:hypothetical protein